MRVLTLGTILLLSMSSSFADGVASQTRPGILADSATPVQTGDVDSRALVEQAKSAYVILNYTVDNAEARDLFLQAAATGDPVAMMWVARGYAENRAGFPLYPDRARAIAAEVIDGVRELARAGDMEATFLLGCAQMQALGTEQNFEEAVHQFEVAAKGGNPMAMHNLGLMKILGKGTPADPDSGAALIMSAYEKGVTHSMAALAFCRSMGTGVPINQDLAVNWLEATSGNELSHANLFLGRMYLQGGSVPQDTTKAAEFFRAAHENGSIEGTFQLALLTGRGDGVTLNTTAGVELLEKAAKYGHIRANARLKAGGLYPKPDFSGEGC